MGRKFYLPLVVLVFFGFSAFAQTGEIRGKVTEGGKEGVPFASVAALLNGVPIQATQTDFDGNYVIKPLNPGKYDVKSTSVGYSAKQISGVLVTVDKASFANFDLVKGVELKAVEITAYQNPLIDKGSPATQKTISYEDIQAAPTRDVNSVVSQQAGVYQKDEGGALNIRGSRDDGTVYYVDGIKVRGNAGLPQKGTEQITVITGGVPAQYGDVTGGVISITTRGPSSTTSGGIEYLTSQFLDPYGYNLGSFSITGPIATKRDAEGKKTKEAIAGYFIAGEYQYDKDPNPPAIKVYKVKDDILADIRKNPIIQSPNSGGYISRSSFFTYDSLEQVKFRQNVAQKAIRLSGKFDIRPVKDVTITLGINGNRTDKRNYTDIYSLMNYDQNTQTIETNWRAFAKLTHRLGGNEDGKEKSASAIKNAYYTLQVDYSKGNTINQNAVHKDKVFDYGYVGQFKSYASPFYKQENGQLILDGYFDTLTTFNPGTQNPNTTNYTTQYYALTAPLGVNGYTDNIFNVQGNGGLINGDKIILVV